MAVSAQEQLDAQAPMHTTSFLRALMISAQRRRSSSQALQALLRILAPYTPRDQFWWTICWAIARDLRALENARHNPS